MVMGSAFTSSYPPIGGTHRISSGALICAGSRRGRVYQSFRQRRRLRPATCTLKTTAQKGEAVDHGVSWIRENKGKVSEVIDFSTCDTRSRRGLKISDSVKSVTKGTELAELPEGTYMSVGVAKALLEKECKLLLDKKLDLGDETLFALAILWERAKESTSAFFGLIDALPGIGELDNPDLWNDAELELLRGSGLYEKSKQVRDGIEEEWTMLNASVLTENREKFGHEDFSLELYRWAMGTVDSRTVPVGDREGDRGVLAPVLQNVSAPKGGESACAKIGWTGTGMMFSRKRLVLTTTREMGSGETITLGLEPSGLNRDYVLERGLAVEGGRADAVEVSFGVSQLDRFYDDKAVVLEQMGMAELNKFTLTRAPRDGGRWLAPPDMEAFLRLMCVAGADAFLLEGVFLNETWEHMMLPVSAENEKAACDAAIGACEDALERYTTHDGVDERVLAARQQLATRVVRAEQEILELCMERFRTTLGSLDALEYYAERRLKALDLLRPIDESEIVDSESGGRVGRAFDEHY